MSVVTQSNLPDRLPPSAPPSKKVPPCIQSALDPIELEPGSEKRRGERKGLATSLTSERKEFVAFFIVRFLFFASLFPPFLLKGFPKQILTLLPQLLHPTRLWLLLSPPSPLPDVVPSASPLDSILMYRRFANCAFFLLLLRERL